MVRKICQHCSLYVVNVSHILFECDCIKDLRNRYWHEIQMNTPEILFLEIENMTAKGKTKFGLNVCNVSYTQE